MPEDGHGAAQGVREHLPRRRRLAGRARPRFAVGPPDPDPPRLRRVCETSGPLRLFEGVPSPLANRKPGEIDFWVVRENTEGEYSQIGGRMFQGTDMEFAIQEAIFTRKGVDRVLKFAFEFASKTKKKHVTSATKSNGIIHTMPFWDERFAEMKKNYPDIKADQYHIDILLRTSCAIRLVRRRGRVQPVRRHPVRPRAGADRLDRRGAVGQHQPRAQIPLDVRAGARLGARHRRQVDRQPDRPDLSGAMMVRHLGYPEAAEAIERAIAASLVEGGRGRGTSAATATLRPWAPPLRSL